MTENMANLLHICLVRIAKLICVLMLSFASHLLAQEQVYKFFTIKEGLPSNNIFKLKFDNKGFLWIAHDNGISKYDGFNFKNYNSPLQKSNVYTDIYVGPDGKIWMTNLGLQVFYIENEEMKLFKEFDLNYTPTTLKMGFLSNGNLLFNAEGGIIEYDIRTNKEFRFPIKTPIQFFAVNKDTVYFNNQLNKKIIKFYKRQLDSINISIPYSIIYTNDSICVSTTNTSKELYIHYGKGFAKSTICKLDFNYNYSEAYGDELYVFTTGNVVKINLRDKKFIPREIYDGHSYTHYAKDRLGNYWYSTINDGIIFMPSSQVQRIGIGENSRFIKLVQFRNSVFGMTRDNQLYRFDGATTTKVLDLNKELNYKPIIVMKNLNNQFLLLGNSSFIYIDSTLKFRRYINEISLKDASLDNKGNLYMATTGNVMYHKFNDFVNSQFSKQSIFISTDSNIKRLKQIGRFTSVKFDTVQQELYFGGIPGFFKKKSNQEAIEIKDGKHQIFSSFIDYQSPYIIVGTIQSGVYILKNGSIFRHFDNLNSTLGNTIIKIKLYNNNVWILSNRGLHTISLVDFNISSFSYIGAVDLNNGADFTINKDILYLITSQQTYAVDMREIRKNPPIIPMYFKYISVGGVRNFNLQNAVFSHNQNSFEIGIESPAASVLGNVEYEYRINNNNWFSLNKGQRELYFSQLSPGNYTISIRQIGIPTLYTLNITIKEPFWDSWWFYVLIIVATMLLIAYFYINRINTLRNKADSEIEKFKLEKALQLNVLSSIRSQMNPHFLFNALNTIQSYIYLNDKKQAISYLGKFSVLTRKILDESNRETITLSEEIETLDLYLQLEKMRFENVLNYSIHTEQIDYTEQIKIPPMLIQPYVENAVKHGLMHKPSNRQLSVIFSYLPEEKIISVVVDDNGIGRKRSGEINAKRNAAHKSFSTQANKTRLDILNSHRKNPISVKVTDKTDAYGNATGTTVQINIPVL